MQKLKKLLETRNGYFKKSAKYLAEKMNLDENKVSKYMKSESYRAMKKTYISNLN